MFPFNVGDRGHVIEKSKNAKTETEEQKQDFYGIDEGITTSMALLKLFIQQLIFTKRAQQTITNILEIAGCYTYLSTVAIR